jgi:Zn finger protein HypA/HybF involved in hydrogenase expression
MMEYEQDITQELMLDGNSIGGIFAEMFGIEITATPTQCATCDTPNDIGALRVFDQAPGIIMRCPACGNVMMRVVKTPEAYYIDARGAAFLRITRPS